MEAATEAFSEGASEGMPTLNWQAPMTPSGRPDPSAPIQTTSLPAGILPGNSSASGTAAMGTKPASLAASRNSTDSSSLVTGVWKMDPMEALTVLGLYRSAEPLERAMPAP